MVVRLRLKPGDAIRKTLAANRHAALVVSSLMTPLAVMLWALAFWRIAADMRWTGEFAISSGLFSHWQVWVALAIGVQVAAFLLQKYVRRQPLADDDAAML
jgi:hypothetical protein